MNTIFSNTKQPSAKKNLLEVLNTNHTYSSSGEFKKYPTGVQNEKAKKPMLKRKEFTVFAHVTDTETRKIPQEIAKLTTEIRQEIKRLKTAQKTLTTQIAQVEKQTIESLPAKPGIYHVRFLEILLSFIRSLISKTSESRTWLLAMQSKRKKRGSLFAVRKKKMGTQYSLSQELQASRNVM